MIPSEIADWQSTIPARLFIHSARAMSAVYLIICSGNVLGR